MKILKTITTLIISATAISTATFAAPPESAKPRLVDSLVTSYLQVQSALASDDLAAAQAAATRYVAAFANASGSLNLEKLQGEAKTIAAATNLPSARTAFSALTEQVVSLVELLGANEDTPLFLAKCPMAFQGKGGLWLQTSQTISNPYFGSSMLTCGSIQTQLNAQTSSAPAHAAATCDHDAMESCPTCSTTQSSSCQMACCKN